MLLKLQTPQSPTLNTCAHKRISYLEAKAACASHWMSECKAYPSSLQIDGNPFQFTVTQPKTAGLFFGASAKALGQVEPCIWQKPPEMPGGDAWPDKRCHYYLRALAFYGLWI